MLVWNPIVEIEQQRMGVAALVVVVVHCPLLLVVVDVVHVVDDVDVPPMNDTTMIRPLPMTWTSVFWMCEKSVSAFHPTSFSLSLSFVFLSFPEIEIIEECYGQRPPPIQLHHLL